MEAFIEHLSILILTTHHGVFCFSRGHGRLLAFCADRLEKKSACYEHIDYTIRTWMIR